MYKSFFKRVMDIIMSLFLLAILSPFVVVVLLLLFVINGKKGIFYVQQRPGLDARLFKILKFKTMNDKKDEKGFLLPDDKRLTRVGKFIRSCSIDELPQLINVIKGDMSFIGPRPLLIEYLNLYNDEQKRRHLVRPGITGWAQVNGRNNISWQQKFELDTWYVDNLSFKLDLQIIILTVKKVLKRDGISKEGFATTVGFNGNN